MFMETQSYHFEGLRTFTYRYELILCSLYRWRSFRWPNAWAQYHWISWESHKEMVSSGFLLNNNTKGFGSSMANKS